MDAVDTSKAINFAIHIQAKFTLNLQMKSLHYHRIALLPELRHK